MRIAIAFYGIPRSTIKSYPSIEEKIINTLPDGAETKIFYHLYDQAAISNKRSGENSPIEKSAYSPFLTHNGFLEVPGECLEKWPLEQIKEYGDTWDDNFQSLSNLMHQLNSLFEVTKLVEDFDPDIVIFLRPDLIYHDTPPHDAYSFYTESGTRNIHTRLAMVGGYNDRFSICNKESYKTYGKRITQALQFCETQKKSLNSEELVKFVIDKANISVYPLSIKASRARVDGTVKKEIFSTYRGMGGAKGSISLITKKIKLLLAK